MIKSEILFIDSGDLVKAIKISARFDTVLLNDFFVKYVPPYIKHFVPKMWKCPQQKQESTARPSRRLKTFFLQIRYFISKQTFIVLL